MIVSTNTHWVIYDSLEAFNTMLFAFFVCIPQSNTMQVLDCEMSEMFVMSHGFPAPVSVVTNAIYSIASTYTLVEMPTAPMLNMTNRDFWYD